MTKLLSKGNSKLAKNVGVWNILAGVAVCGRECDGCYALKEQARWKGTVLKGRNNRWDISKTDTFVVEMVTEILKSKFNIIRVHGSGDLHGLFHHGDDVHGPCHDYGNVNENGYVFRHHVHAHGYEYDRVVFLYPAG